MSKDVINQTMIFPICIDGAFIDNKRDVWRIIDKIDIILRYAESLSEKHNYNVLKLIIKVNQLMNEAIAYDNESDFKVYSLQSTLLNYNKKINKILEPALTNLLKISAEYPKLDLARSLIAEKTLKEFRDNVFYLKSFDRFSKEHMSKINKILINIDSSLQKSRYARNKMIDIMLKVSEELFNNYKKVLPNAKPLNQKNILNIKKKIFKRLKLGLYKFKYLWLLKNVSPEKENQIAKLITEQLINKTFTVNKSIFPCYNNTLKVKKNISIPIDLDEKIYKILQEPNKSENKKDNISLKEEKANILTEGNSKDKKTDCNKDIKEKKKNFSLNNS